MSTPDYYAVLGISSDSSDADIKKRYRDLIVKYHPDRNHSSDAEERTKRINEAYTVLSDPVKRAEYNRRLSWSGLHAQPHRTHGSTGPRTYTYRTYTYRTYHSPSRGGGPQNRNVNPFRRILFFFVKVVLVIVALWIVVNFAILTIGVVLTLLLFYLLFVFLTQILYFLYGRR
ncbi:MAG: DnaJ domain-containing protein [Methanolobus sp.]|nr:DnaJ domain-containing protein [Methanolobus sp.]